MVHKVHGGCRAPPLPYALINLVEDLALLVDRDDVPLVGIERDDIEMPDGFGPGHIPARMFQIRLAHIDAPRAVAQINRPLRIQLAGAERERSLESVVVMFKDDLDAV